MDRFGTSDKKFSCRIMAEENFDISEYFLKHLYFVEILCYNIVGQKNNLSRKDWYYTYENIQVE